MTGTLGQPDWMTAPRTQAVFAALEAAGGADCARLVGGCVRNSLIGGAVDDIDIATQLTPEQVTAALKAAGLRAVPTGVEHGTVTAISEGRPYEITTLRRDVATDGRHAVVAFSTDWGEDAARRDFTLNALYARRDGTILDPIGRGVADAKAGRIVFVGDPERRIAEDHLRILRFFRFFAWYGAGAPDAAALAACAALKGTLAELSAERVSKELLKLLAARDPREAVGLMAGAGVLAVALPEAIDLARFEALVALDLQEDRAADALLRLAALAPDEDVAAAEVARRLRLSNAQRDRLAAALAPEPKIEGGVDAREIRRLRYRLGAQAFADRARLTWARDGLDAGVAEAWRGVLALGGSWTPPAFPLTGDDAMAAGVAKGPKVGAVLRAVEDWWIERDFADGREAALARLRSVAQGMAS